MSALKHNAENERVKRRYFAYLKEARRYSESSLDEVAKALHRFEVYTKFRDFRKFHIEQPIAFKRELADQRNARTDKPLSKATQQRTLAVLRSFFHWLAGQPGFRSRLSYADADYFSLSEKDLRIAKASHEQRFPTLEQVLHVLAVMPTETEVDRRNRAVIALAILTGARDGAIASLKLKHVDLIEGCIRQDARDVKTKFSKSFTSWFFPVGAGAVEIIGDWVTYLTHEKLFGNDDPLFPKTQVVVGAELKFEAHGLTNEHWSSAAPIRQIFRDAFGAASLPYFNPHSFRKTLTQLGERVCNTPEEFKAWSQNLGHDHVMTTLMSYGSVPKSRQAEIIRKLGEPKVPTNDLISQMTALLAQYQDKKGAYRSRGFEGFELS
jgi:integrase/recombinase XerD